MHQFNQLLKSPTSRKYFPEVDGVGVFELHELSGDEALARLAEASAFDAAASIDAKGYQEHVYKWAARLLKGSKATKAEIKNITANLTPSTAYALYTAPVSVTSREEIEKN